MDHLDHAGIIQKLVIPMEHNVNYSIGWYPTLKTYYYSFLSWTHIIILEWLTKYISIGNIQYAILSYYLNTICVLSKCKVLSDDAIEYIYHLYIISIEFTKKQI